MGAFSKLKDLKKSSKQLWSGSENADYRRDLNKVLDPLDLFGRQKAYKAEDAALKQEMANESAKAFERRQFDETQAMLRPFQELGEDQLLGLQNRATAEGYGTAIERLLGGTDAMSMSRNAGAQDYANQMGINRDLSGIGNLQADEAMMLEDMLNQRSQNLAGVGLTTGENIARFGQSSANALGALTGLNSQNLAQGQMAQQAARTGGLNNALAIGGALGGAFGGQSSAPQQSNINYNSTAPSSYFQQGGGMSIFG